MSLFQRLITETQISNPPEPAMDHDLIKLMVLLPAIAIYFRSFRYETPCTVYVFLHLMYILQLFLTPALIIAQFTHITPYFTYVHERM